jgi:CBS domain-containing protein
MFSERVRHVMSREPLLTATPQSTVAQAARLMAGSQVGAVVVVDGGACVGIFTGHDAVARVLATGCDPARTALAEVMTPSPLTISPDRNFGQALHLMHEHGFRQLPVVEDGRPIGIVCARDALDPELEEFICEAQRREDFKSP